MMQESINSGRAARTFQAIIAAQGGDPGVVDDPTRLPHAKVVETYTAPRTGTVASVDPRAIGWGLVELGAGRSRMESEIDPSVGFVVSVKPGDRVQSGQPLAAVHARDEAATARGLAVLRRAIVVGAQPLPPLPLISHRVTKSGVEELTA